MSMNSNPSVGSLWRWPDTKMLLIVTDVLEPRGALEARVGVYFLGGNNAWGSTWYPVKLFTGTRLDPISDER